MKNILIKVVKRKAIGDITGAVPAKRLRANPPTVTAMINDWVAENRQNKLDSDIASRKVIAGWIPTTDL